ncbi:MAG TPA: class I SAM-dependent methyltransferase, partial [Terriglobia bacterium]|nr:class I SAM-dependent methyltransferase [Terriglobia bacterium]
ISRLSIMATDNNTLTRPTFCAPQSEIRNPFEGHELWAACYDEFPNPLLHLEERCLTQILPDLGGFSIADVGCGTGRWLRRWVTQGPKLCIGVDFSPAMLGRAQAEARLRGRLIQAELPQIPLRTESMDVAICAFVLGYLPQLSPFAEELGRILRPGGRLFCTDLHPATQELGWKRSFRLADKAIEIRSRPRSVEEVSDCFDSNFTQVAPKVFWLGDPERPLFEQAGKLDLFEQASRYPSLIIFEWRK